MTSVGWIETSSFSLQFPRTKSQSVVLTDVFFYEKKAIFFNSNLSRQDKINNE